MNYLVNNFNGNTPSYGMLKPNKLTTLDYKDTIEALSKALSVMQILNEVDIYDHLKNHENIFPKNGIDFKKMIESYEKSLIKMALNKTNGNQTNAAKLLNLKLSTLNSKIKKLRINV